jgi:hypothetical protein
MELSDDESIDNEERSNSASHASHSGNQVHFIPFSYSSFVKSYFLIN